MIQASTHYAGSMVFQTEYDFISFTPDTLVLLDCAQSAAVWMHE